MNKKFFFGVVIFFTVVVFFFFTFGVVRAAVVSLGVETGPVAVSQGVTVRGPVGVAGGSVKSLVQGVVDKVVIERVS